MAAYRVAYVLLNPVVAGLVEQAEDYRWSSGLPYLGAGDGVLRVDPNPLFQLLGDDPATGKQRFQEIFEYQLQHPLADESGGSTALEVQRQEFLWLLDQVLKGGKPTGRQAAEKAAIRKAWKLGIPPRAIIAALGKGAASRVYETVRKSKKVRRLGAPSPKNVTGTILGL